MYGWCILFHYSWQTSNVSAFSLRCVSFWLCAYVNPSGLTKSYFNILAWFLKFPQSNSITIEKHCNSISIQIRIELIWLMRYNWKAKVLGKKFKTWFGQTKWLYISTESKGLPTVRKCTNGHGQIQYFSFRCKLIIISQLKPL